jgi:LacI family transcriptional regulator
VPHAHRSTIYDIARNLGISPSTVSRCFHAPEMVRPATREAVLAEARRLGYQPNRLARSLIRGRSLTVGVIVPDIQNPGFSAVIGSVEDAAASRGYAPFFGNTREDVEMESRLVQLFLSYQVDGLIMVSPRSSPLEIQDWVASGVPVVLVNRRAPWAICDAVTVDHRRAAELAIRHLVVDNGRRAILYIAGPARSEANQLRQEGARFAADRFGVALHVVDTEGLPVSVTAQRLMQHWEHLPRFDAVLAYNDLMALGAMQALQSRGVRVPEDVSVMGFDNLSWGPFTSPPLSSVGQPFEDLGRQAFELLDQRLTHGGPARQVVLEPYLVERASTRSSMSL